MAYYNLSWYYFSHIPVFLMRLKTKIPGFLFIWISFPLLLFTNCKGQESFGTRYLELQKTIALPGVKGRIDHLAINLKDQTAYIAALGNNTVEVADLKNGKDIYSIKGLHEPQGVGYIPQTQELFVANGGNGECYFYNAHTYEKTATVRLPSDADDMSYNSLAHKIYVGYGGGGIAVIDAISHEKVADYPLPAHPERFQIDAGNHRIYVNVPDADRIDVIDMGKNKIVDVWKNALLSLPKFNFPMALDTVHNRLFVGYRLPPKLIILDTRSGKKIASLNIAGNSDDIYYDYQTNRIYVSSGGGSISIFAQKDADTYRKIANILTRNGARTSLLVPEWHLYLLAERTTGNKQARLLVYKTIH